jgi:hypothetical protein
VRRLAKASFAGSTDGTGSSRGRFRRAFAALAGTGSIALVLALFAVPAASAAEPWGFEQVTPVNKGGGAVNPFDTFKPTPDGNGLLYTVKAPFPGVDTAGAPVYVRYLASRGATGWDSTALDPPDSPNLAGRSVHYMGVVGSSWDASHAVVASAQALTPGAIAGGGNLYMREARSGQLTLIAASSDPALVTSPTSPQGAVTIKFVAPDGRSALFGTAATMTPGAPPSNWSSPFVLYSWTADEGLRAESVLPASEGGETVGFFYAGNDLEEGPRNSIPRTNGLNHIYFTSSAGSNAAYVRTDGQTRAISVSRIPGASDVPVGAEIAAVSDGGRYALFRASAANARLTESTPPYVVGNRQPLYRYDVEDDSLEYIGSAQNLQQVLQMSQDGRTIVFQSSNTLTADAVTGQLNMYVWRDGVTKFVAAASTSPKASAAGGSTFLRVLSENSRYLAFTDNTQSLAQSFGFDNVSAKCPVSKVVGPGPCDVVYRYDIQEDQLDCVSCRQDGAAPNGNSGDSWVARGKVVMDSRQMQTVADDGTVFFTSPDPLVPGDANGADDAYAWNDGTLRLVSRAKPGTSARFVDATPDGGTVFIATNDAIVGSDVDRSVDLYMSRLGAGYPEQRTADPSACGGSDCLGPMTSPPAPLNIGSVAFAGYGDVIREPVRASVAVTKLKAVTGSAAKLKVRVPDAGRILVVGSRVRRAGISASKGGTYQLRVALKPGAKKQLKERTRLRVRARVSYRAKNGQSASRTIKVIFKQPNTKRAEASKAGR